MSIVVLSEHMFCRNTFIRSGLAQRTTLTSQESSYGLLSRNAFTLNKMSFLLGSRGVRNTRTMRARNRIATERLFVRLRDPSCGTVHVRCQRGHSADTLQSCVYRCEAILCHFPLLLESYIVPIENLSGVPRLQPPNSGHSRRRNFNFI